MRMKALFEFITDPNIPADQVDLYLEKSMENAKVEMENNVADSNEAQVEGEVRQQ